MNGIVEAVGELGQGAMLASALEAASEAPIAADGHTHEGSCLNCGTKLIGSHCHGCGQAAHVHRTIGAFFHDLLHGVFHFEGRVWQTLPMLAWHPGRLSREYIEGRRASYVSPIALFLFCVFLMFAVFHATQGHEQASPVGHGGRRVAQSIAGLEENLRQDERRRLDAVSKGSGTSEIDRDLAAQRTVLATLRKYDPDAPATVVDAPADTSTGLPRLDHAIAKFRKNPDLAIYKLQTYAYKYSWALIPLSVPFLWLLFPFSRRFQLYDHTVFVTYSLCFMTLLVIVAMLAGAVGAELLAALLFLVPPVHMYRQLRECYGLRRMSALLRTVFLLLFAGMALALFFVMIMAQTTL